MKKLLTIFILFIACSVSGQVIKAKAISFAYKYKDDPWSKMKETDILVVFSYDLNRITVYSEDTQEYDIIGAISVKNDQEERTSEFTCIDKDGTQCYVYLSIFSEGENRIVVKYSDAMWVYYLRIL